MCIRDRSGRHARRPDIVDRRPPSRASTPGLTQPRSGSLVNDICRAARTTSARPRSQYDAGVALAEQAVGSRRTDDRSNRSRRSPATERNERDRSQRDHEYASVIHDQLGGVFRKCQPRRCHHARWKRFRVDGFYDARPLPTRDRGNRAGIWAR